MNGQDFILPMSGGCQCGSVTYEITKMPLTLYACHCTECQKQSSSGYGMSMPTPKSGFSVTGHVKYWERTAESGRSVKCAFCPECGTRLFHLPLRNESIVNIKPGTLDNTNWINPVGHLWVSSAQKGTLIPKNALSYSNQPETFEPLYQAWLAQHKTKNA